MRFTVRDCRSDDFDALWAIDQSCFDPDIAYSKDELRFYLRRPGAFTLVAESTDQVSDANGSAILAFLVAESSRRGIGHIITIDVRAQARRHHIGSALLDAAEERLRAAKCHAVRLDQVQGPSKTPQTTFRASMIPGTSNRRALEARAERHRPAGALSCPSAALRLLEIDKGAVHAGLAMATAPIVLV